MMRNKTLILLCDNYPYSNGEYFIDDELKIIFPFFEKIIIITNSTIKADLGKRFMPNNVIIHTLSTERRFRFLDFTYVSYVFKEIYYLIFKLKKKINFLRFKILLNEIRRSVIYKNNLKDFLNSTNNFDISNSIFYSYWLDYKSLSLCMLRKENKGLKCVSRAHRWDIYFEENLAHYLPFKSFELNNLFQTFSISEDGKNYLENLPGVKKDKVMISRLGKSNDFSPIFLKENKNSFVICSCSNLAKVKRVDLIVEVLSLLKTENVSWYHFGGGVLYDELLCLAENTLKNCTFRFMGAIENAVILDFYNNTYVDLFINLSESEGIPVSIMEAQSAAIPVIATNVGGVSEIVNELNGWLVTKQSDAISISSLIDDYFKTTEKEFLAKREAAYLNWEKYFNGQKNYQKFAMQLSNL